MKSYGIRSAGAWVGLIVSALLVSAWPAQAGDSTVGIRTWYAGFDYSYADSQTYDMGKAPLCSVDYAYNLTDLPVSLLASAGYGTGWNRKWSNQYGQGDLDAKRTDALVGASYVKTWRLDWMLGAYYHYYEIDMTGEGLTIKNDVTLHGPEVLVGVRAPLPAGFSVQLTGSYLPYVAWDKEYKGTAIYSGNVARYTESSSDGDTDGFSCDANVGYRHQAWAFAAGYRIQQTNSDKNDSSGTIGQLSKDKFEGIYAQIKRTF